MDGINDSHIAEVIKYFRGNPETVAVQPRNGDPHPRKLDQPLSVEGFRQHHLSGDNCIGFYVLTPSSDCFAACIDFDDHSNNPDPEWLSKTEAVYFFLQEQEIECFVEISSSGKGSHVWILFENETEGWIPRSFFRSVVNYLGITMPEIYPRQDRVNGRQLGNQIRLPYFNQSKFVDVENDWEPIIPEFKTVDVEDLKVVASRIGSRLAPATIAQNDGEVTPYLQRKMKQKPNSLLTRRWNLDLEGLKDKSLSACVQSLVGAMVDEYAHPLEIDEALKIWGSLHGYDKIDREDFRQGAILKAYQYKQTPKVNHSTAHGNFKDCALASLEHSGMDKYIQFGISDVDQSIDGVNQGEMCLIMARPGHGKSAFGSQWLENASKMGHQALMLQAEMSATEMGRRSLMKITGRPEAEWEGDRVAIAEQVAAYYQGWSPPHFRNVTSIEDVEREVVAYKDGYGIGAVVIDYVQLLRSSKSSRYECVTDISQRLKVLAREQDVAMVALCQASREVEYRKKVEFLASDLKESGSLEQDADIIAGLFWWGRSTNKSANPNCAELQIIKRRNGPIRTSSIRLLFDAQRQTFSNWNI